MSGSRPPNPSQYPQEGGQRSPYEGYGPQQGYGAYGPPSGGRQAQPNEGYHAPEQGYGQYGQPSQGWQQGGWSQQQQPQQQQSQGGWQGAQGAQDASWGRGGTSQQMPPAPYPGQAGPPSQSPYGHPYAQPYGQQYGYDNGGYRSAPPPPKKRNLMLPIVLAVALVLVAGGAVGAYELSHGHGGGVTAAQATATPGIPAGFKAFDDSTAHIHMLLPSDWKTSGSLSSATGMVAANADGSDALIVMTLPVNVSSSDTSTFTNSFLQGMETSMSGTASNKAGPTNVSVAGQNWSQESEDIGSQAGALHVVVLVTSYNQSLYVIAYTAEKSAFANEDKSYFQPIVKSFTFTK